MKNTNRWAGILVAAWAVTATAAYAQEKLTYADLARRLTDLELLATLPPAGEGAAQCSSYDRAAKYDPATNTYIHWGANGDGTGIIRKEGDAEVIAEMTGPGCIWRIWTAKVGPGHVKIYLDGNQTPAVDLPFSGYFDGKNEPFVYPSLVHTTARGLNSYVPIPYQKSCKVVAEKNWGRYYHFTYGTFAPGTQVPTFRRDLGEADQAALKAADEFLSGKLGTDPAGPRQDQATQTKKLTVPAGGSAEPLTLKGPRAVTQLVVKARFADRADEMDALRQLVLKITWDDDKTPAVWAPLGDFFGTAPGVNQYKSLPLGMTDDGFYSLWYMPFASSARIEIANDGPAARELELAVTHAPLSRPIEQLARFHAKWHRDAFLPETKDRFPDWTMLKTTGRGRFCGVMLHVWNPKGGECPPAGEGRYWWGEGDEKFFVDGEKFPSTFGTGSEDYFGYAWGDASLFQNAFHNQTLNSGNKGHISVNRWHITETVPFQAGFEGVIEKYFPNDWPTRYACIAYWYQAPGGNDPYGPTPLADRTGYYEMPAVFRVKDAIEGEAMKVLSVTGGEAKTQDMTHFPGGQWSGQEHLLWIKGKPGDKLTLALPVKEVGTYELCVRLTKAKDYGVVQLHLDDQKLGEPIDLYNDGVVPTGELKFAAGELSAGQHKLVIEITGANPKAIQAHLAGLDYVKLQKQP